MSALLQDVWVGSAHVAELLVGWVLAGVVLVAAVALLLRAIPRLSAAMRSLLWTGVLLVTVLLPAVSFHAASDATGAEHGLHARPVWAVLLLLLWAVLSAVRLLQLGRSALRLRTIAGRAAPVAAPESVADLLAGDPRRSRLCVSADVHRPSAVGFFRPRILLPAGLLEELSGPELEHVVLHELEHLRRHDDWVNLLQKLSLALFPLHPALFWLDRRLCLERELACDDRVLAHTHARKAYAACLARLAEESFLRRGLSLALGLLGVRARSSELSGRVQRILQSTETATMARVSAWQVGAISMAAAVLLAGGAELLAHSPIPISFAPSGSSETTGMIAAPAQAGNDTTVLPLAQGSFRAVPVVAQERVATAGQHPVVRTPAVVPVRAPLHRRTPVMVPALASLPKSADLPLRRVALTTAPEDVSAPVSTAYVVLTTWSPAQRSGASAVPRVALAVEQGSPQTFQPTYAAVPLRNGWLLIQL